MERAADTPEGCAAVQRDFDKLEKCADVNLIKFRKRKCKPGKPEPGEEQHQAPARAGVPSAGKQLCSKELGVLGNISNVALQGHTNSIRGSSGRVLPEGLGR